MIPKVTFKFDIEKDLWNTWDTCNSDSIFGCDFKKGIPQTTMDLCGGKKFEDIKNTFKDHYKKTYSCRLVSQVEKSFNEAWSKIGEEYFKRLKKITKKPINLKKITAYLTFVRRCPYNHNKGDPFFFVNFFGGIPNAMMIAGHEIMHIHLHNLKWWEKVEKEIGNEKTGDLKEALTVLLNLEFRDLWIAPDRGYDMHKELRTFIKNKWKKEKNFDKLTNKCIKWIKKNGIK